TLLEDARVVLGAVFGQHWFLSIGAIPGRALPGYVADRARVFNTMCATSFICSIFILGLWLTAAGNEVKTTVFTILYGFWSGAAISLTPVYIGEVCKIEDYGKRCGAAFGIASLGVLIGIPIAGTILEADKGGYQGLIIFAGCVYMAAFLAFFLARWLASR
ncbi:hypothetical protein V491_07426, partial [Pseudogymnoascus sp. VKM F-3775]